MMLRAFVFDADQLVRQVLSEILRRRGYEVFAFASGTICQPCDGHVCADVIIADVVLGRGSGAEFLLAQRAIGCGNRHLALMAASWTQADRACLLDLGCRAFSKPFKAGELRAWLDEVEAEISQDRPLSELYLQCTAHPHDTVLPLRP